MAKRPKIVQKGPGWTFKGAGKIFKDKGKAQKKRNKMYPKKADVYKRPVTGYNVRDASGKMQAGVSEAEKKAILESGGEVINTIKGKKQGYVYVETPIQPAQKQEYESVAVGEKAVDLDTVKTEDAPSPISPDTVSRQAEMASGTLDDVVQAEPKTNIIPESPPSTVSHLGITMSQEQFKSDFPPNTQIIDVPVVVSTPKPKTPLPDPESFTGIPGPGSAPAPGSLGEKAQAGMDKLIVKEETLFKSVTDPLLEKGTEMVEASKSLPLEGKALKGLGTYLGGTVLKTGAAFIEGGTEIVRPGLLREQAEFMGAMISDPEVREQVIKSILADPFGAVAQIAGGAAGGYVAGKVGGKLLDVAGFEQPKTLVRLEGIDADVKATALELVDDSDVLLTGKPSKTLQFPEVEIAPIISKKKLPKAMSEIMDVELDDLSGSGKLLGVADEGGITVLEKIDLPEGALDDLLGGKKVTVKGTLKTETMKMGSEKMYGVDDLVDPLTGKSMKIQVMDDVIKMDAKELGPTIDIAEETVSLPKLSLKEGEKFLDDVLELTPLTKRPQKTVTFEGSWLDEGVEGVLGKGKRRYDVKGALIDTSQKLDDVDDFDIKMIEPSGGKKTPWDLPEQKAALKGTQGILKDGPPEPVTPSSQYWKKLVSDGPPDPLPELRSKYLKELVGETVPIVKIVTEASKTSAVLPFVGGASAIPKPSVVDTSFPKGGLYSAPPEQKSGYPIVKDDGYGAQFSTFETPPWAKEKKPGTPKIETELKTDLDTKPIDITRPFPVEIVKPLPIDITKPKPDVKPIPGLLPFDITKPKPIDIIKPKPIDIIKSKPIDIIKPKPIDITKPKPIIDIKTKPVQIPDITPIQDIFPDLDIEPIHKPIQIIEPIEKRPPTPILLQRLPRRPRLPLTPVRKKRRPRIPGKTPRIGWETKQYRMPEPKDFMDMKKTKVPPMPNMGRRSRRKDDELFFMGKKKGKGLPRL